MPEEILSAEEAAALRELANAITGGTFAQFIANFTKLCDVIKQGGPLADRIPRLVEREQALTEAIADLEKDLAHKRVLAAEARQTYQQQVAAAKAERLAELERETREHDAVVQARQTQLEDLDKKLTKKAVALAALEQAEASNV